MPIYEYECENHGAFELLRSISESRKLGECPACQSSCARILSAPHISGVPRQQMIAHETNERSRHEPKVQTRGHRCTSNCQHGTQKSQAPKRYTGARPWVVEHA